MTCKGNIQLRNIIYIIGLSVLCTTYTAHAQSITKLTDSNIEAFITETTEMTKGNNLLFNSKEIQDYMNKHLHDKARFKSSIRYNIPGFPTKESSFSLDKAEFIESIKKGADSLSDYENEIEIKDIKISKKKNKATVKTRGFERGTMPVSMDGTSTQFVPVEGESSCVQILSLEDGYIQMYNANCTTVISFSEP